MQILQHRKEVFLPGLGTLKSYKAKIVVDPNVTPRYHNAQSVPNAMKKEELAECEPVQFADWAAPIVPVLKSDGMSVRICGEFKKTVNQASVPDPNDTRPLCNTGWWQDLH